jgi:hypothetical protein
MRKLAILGFVLGLLLAVSPIPARAQIALDGTPLNRSSSSNVGSDSFSYTTGSTANMVMLVSVSYNSTTTTISSVKYNSVTMTNVRTDTGGGSTLGLFRLVAPASGANTVLVTLSSSLSGGRVITSQVFTASGVDQSNPIDANNSATTGNSTSWSLALTTVADNAWIFDSFTTGTNFNSTIGKGASQTLIGSTTSGTGTFSRASYRGPVSPAGSTTMSYTLTNSTNGTTLESSCSLTPAASATSTHRLLLLGVGGG